MKLYVKYGKADCKKVRARAKCPLWVSLTNSSNPHFAHKLFFPRSPVVFFLRSTVDFFSLYPSIPSHFGHRFKKTHLHPVHRVPPVRNHIFFIPFDISSFLLEISFVLGIIFSSSRTNFSFFCSLRYFLCFSSQNHVYYWNSNHHLIILFFLSFRTNFPFFSSLPYFLSFFNRSHFFFDYLSSFVSKSNKVSDSLLSILFFVIIDYITFSTICMSFNYVFASWLSRFLTFVAAGCCWGLEPMTGPLGV